MFRKIIPIAIAIASTSGFSYNSIATDESFLQKIEACPQFTHSFLIKNSNDIVSLFPKTVEEIDFFFQTAKNNVQDRLQKIINIPHKNRTFENTILQYDKALAYFLIHGSILGALEKLHPDKDICDKANETLLSWSNCIVDLFQANKEIYKAFKEFQASNEFLNDERRYYFSNIMSAFQSMGLELDTSQYLEMKELQKHIALLSAQFETNISQNTPTLLVKRDELLGLDENFINSLARDGDNYILACDYPTSFQIKSNCSVEATRRNYLYMFSNRAYPKNKEVLNQLINRRDDLASLLGYKSYAHLDITHEMAQTVENVENFLDNLALKSYSKIINNWTLLLNDLPKSVVLTTDRKIKPWDVGYVVNQYTKKHFQIDQNEIAEYFPMETTLRKLLNIYEQFFGLKFQVINQNGFWDPSVQTIEVRQKDPDQSLIGYVLLDLFPRVNKFSHCCCSCIVPPMNINQDQTIAPALAVVIANFSHSTSEKPSLLKHHEVKTFFHEFGHAIHALFGRAEMPTTAGYNTKTDFVEAPSQLLEEWMWDRDILKMISCHYQTGKSLSDSSIEGLIKTRDFFDAAHNATGGNGDHDGTQLVFSKTSLFIFKEGKDKDLTQLNKEIYNSTPQIVAYDPELHYNYAFGHLTSYGAKYYSYPWSKQLALKIFNYIKAHGGLLDPAMGQRYISKIIGRGGSCDPNDLVRDFLQADSP